ncbi:MAG: NAD-dependent epimerase/dehydratase family protein [Planctomycetaceae bacterium]|nr:NAD-dependent epimerase/dehydratase family protein [Planctomycetaceae bacterium]
MKALLTGISGFAGAYLAEHLLAAGDSLWGLTRDGSRQPQWPESIRQVPVITWDPAHPQLGFDELLAAVQPIAPDCIYHLAALSLPELCGATAPTPECLAANVEATRQVIELALGLTTPPRMVFVSTSRVYAPVDPARAFVDEGYPTQPGQGYGQSKLLAEAAVLAAAGRRGLDAVISRSFQHTGPRQDPRLMLPEWASQLAAGSRELRVRHLNAWIDCTDVRDVVRAYRLLAIHGRAGEIYNVGSGIGRRTGDVVEELCRIAGYQPRIVERVPGLKQDPIADCRRLADLTGWRPEIPWEQTLRDTLADWRQRSPAADS